MSSSKFLFAAASLLTIATCAHATSLTWDGNGSTAPNPNGGSGTWNTNGNFNWWDGTTNVTWPAVSSTNDDAIFGNTAGTVTLSGTVIANDLTFNTTGYTLTGGTQLTLDGTTPTITTASGVTATINSVIGGAAGLTKAGTGTLTLIKANTFTGGTTINAGSLKLDFSNAGAPGTNILASSGALTLGGGNLTLTGKAGTANSQTVAGLTLATGTTSSVVLTAGATGGSVSLDLGSITRNTGATVNFTLPTAGSISTSTALGAWATTGSGATTQYATSSGGTIAAIVGTAAATGADLTDTTGTVSYDLAAGGGTVPASVSVNTIRYTAATGTTAPGATLFSVNGLMNAGTGVWTIGTNALTIGADMDLVVNTANNGITISGAIKDNSGGASALTKTSAGTLTLSGSNTYTGVTTINAGTLQFSKRASLYNNNTASWTDTNLVVNSGATAAFNVGGAGQFTTADIDIIKGLGTATGGFKSGSNIGFDTTNASPVNFTYSSAINNTNGGLNTLGVTKLGSNTLTLSGANTYTGGTTVTGGTMTVQNDQSAANGGWNVTGGTAQFAAGSIVAVAGGKSISMTSAMNVAGTVTNNGTLSVGRLGNLTLNNGAVWTQNGSMSVATSSNTFASATMTVNSGATFTYAGSSTITINPNNTAQVGTATLTIAGGNFITGMGFNETASTGPAASLILSSGGTLKLSNNIASLATSVANMLNIQVADAAGGGGVIDTNGFNTAITQAITDGASAGSLTKTGAGTLTLSGANGYTGGTTVNGGTLALSGSGTLGASTGALAVNTNGSLNLGTTTQTVGAVTLGGGTISNGTISGSSYTSTGGTISANLGNNTATLTQTSGSTTLSGINAYTGVTSVNGGSLLVNGSLAANSAVSVAAGATLGGNGIVNGTIAVSGTLQGGVGTVTTDKLTTGAGAVSLASGSVVQLALGANGNASQIAVGAGGITFQNNQAFSFLDLGGVAAGNTYNLITGAATGLDTSNWTITNSGWTGSFTDTAGTITLTLTAVPEPGTYGLIGAGALAGVAMVRRRRKHNNEAA